jgi:hypothetical protein
MIVADVSAECHQDDGHEIGVSGVLDVEAVKMQ